MTDLKKKYEEETLDVLENSWNKTQWWIDYSNWLEEKITYKLNSNNKQLNGFYVCEIEYGDYTIMLYDGEWRTFNRELGVYVISDIIPIRFFPLPQQ
jgi:hypothetical protein